MESQPNFENFRRTILREGPPGPVPLFELFADPGMVEAVLEEPFAALRPGMEGIAKIDVGRRRLLWIWTHEMLDWLRLSLWSFLP